MSTDDTLEFPDTFPEESSNVLLEGPAGALEALTDMPDAEEDEPVTAVAVLCHPHPEHGGTMHNKVVHIMERSFRELGAHTVRFNFRGVGASAGEFDGGIGETDDLIAVAQWALRVLPEHELWLGGFSFGSYVATRGTQMLPATQLVTVAPPVSDGDFTALPRPRCPWLVVQGEEDEIVSPDSVFSWVEEMEDPPQLVRMEDAGHFFHRRLMDLRGVIKNGVRRQRAD